MKAPCGEHLDMAQQERALVEALAAQPAGDLVVALARVARAARGHHVQQGVAATARDRQHAVLLQRRSCLAAVGAAAPRLLLMF